MGKSQHFKYKLEGINGIIGSTGSGKTELVRRLGYCLKVSDRNISYTAQVPYVYDDTFRNNIFMGKTPTEDELVLLKKLVHLFGLNELTTGFEDLLNLPLGENGKRLSGGQIKRMCLVRTLMGDAKFIIWDDPFSSVDLILERKIMDELKRLELLKSRTVFLTSHRMSTIKFCHSVTMIEKDKGIVEYSGGDDIFSSNILKFFEKQRLENHAHGDNKLEVEYEG